MRRKRRVVVTGLGVVAANGIGKDEFWRSISRGITGIKNFSALKSNVKAAGEIQDYNPDNYFSQEEQDKLTRFSQFSIIAAKEALEDAGLDIKKVNPSRIGVSLGTTTGGLEFMLDQFPFFINNELEKIHPFTFSKTIPSAATGILSIYLGITGPSKTFCSACAASTDAIGWGFDSIKRGSLDIAICGGSETLLHPFVLEICYKGGILSEGANRHFNKFPKPFDKQRDGTVIGEGAGILLLEELGSALKRKAPIYAEVVGYATTSDAHHMVRPLLTGEEAKRAILEALEESKLSKEEVNYINAHGTGTVKNDKVETEVIKKAFGNYAYKIPISSTKAMTGHTFGAAGAIESIICVLVIKEDLVPPTINYESPDPECDLDYVPNKPRRKKINVALCQSFGFGGENSVLVFRKYR